jgi:hypothetical protein
MAGFRRGDDMTPGEAFAQFRKKYPGIGPGDEAVAGVAFRAAWNAATERAVKACDDAANDLNSGLRRSEFHCMDARPVEAQVAILKWVAARIRGGTP